MRNMKRQFILGVLAIAIFSASLKPANALFDKTRFAFDLGVAFFAFHHWVLAPYQQGAFSSGAPHRTKALIKGGAALLFALNRVNAADRIAHNSKSPLLQRVAGSIDSMSSAFSSVGQRLKSGVFNSKDVDMVNGDVNQVGADSATAGIPIKDRAVAIPGG